ncbi:MAG TPA: DciA family protein [Steroidobacteraceae bacterium]|nr:DciA family protein [Steroidobacteraceae bacterium]
MKKPTLVSDLLAQGQGMLQRLREGTAEAQRTLQGLRRHLPPELSQQVWGAIARDGTLTVLVRSAAWGTRVRYLAPRFKDALASELGIAIDRVRVKVRSGRD